ncbi:MATE family efflux transporter [Sphingomonas sp. Leaf33]|uniref:MATE family efflux transporter n=1 Tax=Sphingomonas sp. Leaf33 TaxID=1736215 RepID=UPI0006F3631E|nr:MATE family efflux transporter [Sphingomonas sp. Leaf33]KQN19568.1 MATE family efflux transporter [Sphingomonas sp. Leaf33]
MSALPLTRRAILAQAWPIMLGQATVPLVGIVDTAVIGRTGDAAALAGVALGGTIVSFLFWSFGFLRMGMTGLTAQASGRGDVDEVAALLARGLAIGAGLGALLAALQVVLVPAAFLLFAGDAAVDAAGRAYVSARFFGAPAALAVFAINGWLLGLGRTRAALGLQGWMNLVNIAACALVVWRMGLGAWGVGIGTAIAEWSALIAGLAIVAPHLRGLARARVFGRAALARLFAVNADIMVRTIALLTLLAWFANAGARLGAETLAANQILMQAVALTAFVLDGFAFTAEARVGHAIGAGSRAGILRAIRLTGEFSLAAAILFAGLIALGGAAAIPVMTTNPAVQSQALALLPFVVALPVIGMPAWLLDGIFIGATDGRALRNAAILATALYIATDLALRGRGDAGVWIALTLSYLYRAATLGAYVPRLLRRVA